MTSRQSEMEEDEDVVISGSELHDFLSKMGYSDFEVIPVHRSVQSTVPCRRSRVWTLSSMYEIAWKTIWNVRRYLTKDIRTSQKQLAIISKASYLLDDHAIHVRKFIEDSRGTLLWRFIDILCSARFALIASLGLCVAGRSNEFAWFLTIPVMWSAIRYEYTKWRFDRNLKRLIAGQMEVYNVLRKGIRILNRNYRMNTNVAGSKWTDIDTEKLKNLQPIIEIMKESMETLSKEYHCKSLAFWNRLPFDYYQNPDFEITAFQDESYSCIGEITYQSLKQSFYRFLLIQSEMLRTLAVLIARNDSSQFDSKLSFEIGQLLDVTNNYKVQLVKIIDSFRSHRLVPIDRKHRTVGGSKWQDLYVHLHLTSRKVHRVYNYLSEILDDLENHLELPAAEIELLDAIAEKLDTIHKECKDVQDSSQINCLLVTRLRNITTVSENSTSSNKVAEPDQIPLPIVRDSEPEILDEVFEEYIREKYVEALFDDDGKDSALFQKWRLDELLSKNLMSELKEILVEKQRDMCERETRALARMKNSTTPQADAVRDANSCSQDEPASESNGIPLEKSLLPDTASENDDGVKLEDRSRSVVRIDANRKYDDHEEIPPPPPLPRNLFTFDVPEVNEDEKSEEEQIQSSISLAQALFAANVVETIGDHRQDNDNEKILRASSTPSCFATGDVLQSNKLLPDGVMPLRNLGAKFPAFLTYSEETFIGSGENSDEELIEDNESESESES